MVQKFGLFSRLPTFRQTVKLSHKFIVLESLYTSEAAIRDIVGKKIMWASVIFCTISYRG